MLDSDEDCGPQGFKISQGCEREALLFCVFGYAWQNCQSFLFLVSVWSRKPKENIIISGYA